MDENIAPTQTKDKSHHHSNKDVLQPTDSSASLVEDNHKSSDSAPALGSNASSSSIDLSSKVSLPDITTTREKSKHHRQSNSHRDFPEIRAYYAK
jgi:hypothetical protein